ncbi:major facilitator superfamily MFS-1 [Dendrothele bispora CBS 962.96]|uniref:Major facilitator superfamily MFS-1 n=1 Tax=Dendrothele bispora (strain CBS 962.96) TaxID=1314807 RepID=A0A4S8MHE1_DENBC|nr:major facilitator superfamily MFS-1 [Dendrothele bispora CBS 962.96]
MRRVLGRVSFSNASIRRPSFVGRWKNNGNNVDHEGGTDTIASPFKERPPIPSVVQSSGEVYMTPLPILPMVVLSIAMLGEFLSANVSAPFLLFMVKGFGTITDEAEIAFMTGILVAAFFLTQFLTSLLWATVADKHGRRVVLVVSLFGSAATCAIFGTSTSFPQAVCIRLLQGIFAGAVGVARSSVAFVTDSSNEGRAYAILGFCWGFGGVAGAIIGGTFETPEHNWPNTFGNIPLFIKYPYLLPTLIAASVTFLGSILACFLGRDGGPREGAIQLPPEKINTQHPTIPEEESTPPSPIFDDIPAKDTLTGSIRKKVGKKLSSYFAGRVPDAQTSSSAQAPPSPIPIMQPPLRLDRPRIASTNSRRFGGSAYGYSVNTRNRLASNATASRRRGSLASSIAVRRRGSNVDGLPSSYRDSTTSDLNFAQRLLMANENAVTNIADLWVASAMNVDNEDPFYSDEEEEDLDDEESILDLGEPLNRDDDEGVISDSPSTPTTNRYRRESTASSNPNRSPVMTRLSFSAPRRPQLSPRRPSMGGRIRYPSNLGLEVGTPTGRRFSNAPSIFAHTGVRTPSAVLDAQQLLTRTETEDTAPADNLAPIMESRIGPTPAQATTPTDEEAQLLEKPPSLWSQLPVLVIVQYGLLALHSTTHDQVFMSYLVTDYDSGGLNLNAGHFAQLIALMCLCQIAYQFYLYPNLGPPRGRFSHLTMFRLGSLFFIPSYLSVILYRVPFASEEEDGNFLLMTALTLSTAVRFCGATFAYTAISILLNYMTPPQAVGFANGIAQSIVSLARCLGPVLGGWIWSVSIEGNPNGYPLGFMICAGACALAVLHSFFIR